MIRLRLFKVALTFCALLLSSAINAETIKDRISLSFSDLRTMPVEMDGKNYVNLIVEKLPDMNRSVGNAELPCEIRSYIVPENDTHFQVTITRCDSIVYPLLYTPYICQEPVTTNDTISNYIHTYEAPRFPTSPVEIINDGYLFGNNHIIDVRITPFIYERKMNRLLILTNIQYTITTSQGSTYSLYSARKDMYASSLSSLPELINPTVIKRGQNNTFEVDSIVEQYWFGRLTGTPLVGKSLLPAYQYMIVTNRELAPAFDRIVGLKKQKGYDAGIVYIEDILADTKYVNGDEISGINDDAGKLRAFLCDAYKTGSTKFVLLGGGKDIVPIRYAKTYADPNTPTDLYFSDFNGNWDLNKNGSYGENADGVDFYPEIFVGRLLCNTKEEIDNYTYKLLKYELNPGNGDFSYLRKGFFIQSDDMQFYKEAQGVINASGDIFDMTKIFEEEPAYNAPHPTFPTGNEVVAELNSTKYGFFSPHGHGNPFGIATKTNGNALDTYNGIISQQYIPKSSHHHVIEDAHGLDIIDNADYPMIFYSISCDIAPFDIYSTYAGHYNMGESFTLGGHYGGPIFIGNTRYGIIRQSAMMEQHFFRQLLLSPCIGKAQAFSKFTYRESYDNHHVKLTSNLLGCPELPMWTKTPEYINCTGENIALPAKSITIDKPGTRISKIHLATGDITTMENVQQNERILINTLNNVVSISGENLITKFLDLTINNITNFADGYYFVRNLNIGFKSTTENDIVFKNCTVSFNAEGNVLIYPFTAENGSNLTIISKGDVKVYGGKIKAGAKVKIIAPNIVFHHAFECEDGAELTILADE